MPPLLKHNKTAFCHTVTKFSLDNILPRTLLCNGNGPMVQWIPYSWGALGSNIFPISISKTWSASWNRKSSALEFMPPLLTPYKPLFVVQSQNCSLDNILPRTFLCSGNGPMVQWIPYSWGALGSNIFPISKSKTWSASWNKKIICLWIYASSVNTIQNAFCCAVTRFFIGQYLVNTISVQW